jgi:hypothetical protein
MQNGMQFLSAFLLICVRFLYADICAMIFLRKFKQVFRTTQWTLD